MGGHRRLARGPAGRGPGGLTGLGVVEAAAANEPDHRVRCTALHHDGTVCADDVAADAEIAEVRWLDPDGPPPDDLAPLLSEATLPALRQRRRER